MLFNPLPIMISALGVYLLFKVRAFFLIHPIKTARLCIKTASKKDAFRSLSLALAGTLGVGNVLGVAVGLIIGGAGSVFWLFVSTVFAAAIKYSEVLVCSKYSEGGGGMISAARQSVKRGGKALAALYALCVVLLSLVMGAALQCGTVTECLDFSVSVPGYVTAPVLAALVLVAVTGGAGLIEKITAVVIPVTTVLYIALTVSVIVIKRDGIAEAVSLIFSSAFTTRAAGGGILGFLAGAPFREGYSRGILSNEAGAGTSSFAHGRSEGVSPEVHGIMGVAEVFFDTALLCMLTALSVLLSVPDVSLYTEGMPLILDGIGSVLGEGSRYLISFSVFAFAYATVICWYYYGECAFSYFSVGKRWGAVFTVVYIAFVSFGFLPGNITLVKITDALMVVLASVTFITLIKNSDGIKRPSELGGDIT